MTRRALGLALAALITACAGDVEEPATPVTNSRSAAAIPGTGPPVVGMPVAQGSASLLPPLTRRRRRVHIDQLKAAIGRATGGLSWLDLGSTTLTKAVDNAAKGAAWHDQGGALFDELAQALGRPDHIDVTQEDLSVSPLFVKFLNDAARQTCAARVGIDAHDSTSPEARHLIVGVELTDSYATNPGGMDAAVQRMVLLFLGRRIAGEGLEPWRQLFQTVADGGGDPLEGWRAACVAAMTHPEFYTF